MLRITQLATLKNSLKKLKHLRFTQQLLAFLNTLGLKFVRLWFKLKDSTTSVPLKLMIWKNISSKTSATPSSHPTTASKFQSKTKIFRQSKFLELLIGSRFPSTTRKEQETILSRKPKHPSLLSFNYIKMGMSWLMVGWWWLNSTSKINKIQFFRERSISLTQLFKEKNAMMNIPSVMRVQWTNNSTVTNAWTKP